MNSEGPVLIVASFPSSIIAFRGALIRSLIDRGKDVHVATPNCLGDSPIRVALQEMGVTVYEIPLRRTGTNPVADLRLLRHLFALMRRIRPGMVFCYTVKPVIFGLLAARMAGVAHRFALITGLGYAFTDERNGAISRIIWRLYRLALTRVEKVFFQNPDDQAFFRDRGMLSASVPSVVVNGSGIDVSRFVGKPPDTKSPGFLMIARFLGDKGVREYVAAARKVRTQYPGTPFRMVGWIDANPDAISKDELDAWIGEGVIEYLGHLDDVRPALEDTSVYVLPSYREGTPRTVLEAMAMGRPIITTDAPGCRETVIDGENGFLVPVKSVDGLVEAMQRFIDDPDLAETMGRKSRVIAEDKYDVHKVNAVMLREMGIT